MQRTKLRKKRDPLQYSRMFLVGALEPAESFFFVAQRDRHGGNQWCRYVSLLSCLNKSCKNISRVRLAAHARIGDSKAAARQIRCVLGSCVKSDRVVEIPLLAVGGGQNRIQVKVIWIKLERSLAFDNGVIDAIVSQVGGRGDVAGDRRHRI